MPGSRLALFLRPHRGAGIGATPSPVRARVLGGGDAWFAHGAVFAAAPWRGGLEQRPHWVGRGCWVGGALPGSSGGAFIHGGDRPLTVWRGLSPVFAVGLAVMPGSRLARFLPPHRGAVG
jgi:hypothetical protein